MKADEVRVLAIARIWEPILPVDRGERYEDPLDELLEESDTGKVTGGGTQLTASKEIDFVEIELELVDDEDVFDHVMEILEERGAPKHSQLVVVRGDRESFYSFGVVEGIELKLDLMPSDEELDDLIEDLAKAAGARLDLRGPHKSQDDKVAIHLYSVDAESLWASIEPVVMTHPVCRRARVVVRRGHPDGRPREVSIS